MRRAATTAAARHRDREFLIDQLHLRGAPIGGLCWIRAPKPGGAPYVSVGQAISADTEVCLIEVMKLFTSVPAGVAGTVRKVLVEDAELVEYDQPLFLIEPA